MRTRSSPAARLRCLLLAALSLAGPSSLHAQGGPPMLTDDPGTPGPNKWEINVGWTTDRTQGSNLTALPELDLNYGIGERIELTYFVDYDELRPTGQPARWGLSDSQFAVKWRFLDNGDGGTQVSAYPQITFLTPGSRSDRRGLAEGPTSYQLPFEFSQDLKYVSVNLDVGHSFATQGGSDGWFGGICLGRQLRKGWELDGEIHMEADARAAHDEAILNLATRIDLSEKDTLMLLVGRDLSNSLGSKSTFMSYVGFQIRI